jgi:hypothetical protein
MSAQTLDEGGNHLGVAVRGIGKLIDSHSGGSGRNARIPRVEVLVEVLDTEANYRDMNALCTHGPQAKPMDRDARATDSASSTHRSPRWFTCPRVTTMQCPR